jgi:hypothetical protein
VPIEEHSPLVVFGIPALGALLALLCLLFALRAGKRQRLVDNLPTCKTTGVFIGQVELKGTAEAEQPLISYLAEQPCVHYAWRIDEHWSRTVRESYTDSKGRRRTRTRRESGWKTVADGGDQIPFYLRDDCGVIRVDPEKADTQPVEIMRETCGRSDPLYYGKGPDFAVSHSDHRRRFTETAIPLHTSIYVMGPARERRDVVAAELAHDPDAPMYLISTKTEGAIRAGLAWKFWSLGIFGLLLFVGGWLGRDAAMEIKPALRVTTYVLFGAGYLLAGLLGWIWMAYNSMIDLRQRVRQAWANVDVQLKRRADLIPNLVRAVEGLRDHEQRVQTELVELRSQMRPTTPGQPGPDPRGCAAMVRGIVEQYPELRADEAFMNLQQNLVDTEQRIALARGYFNEIASFYNTRLQIVPDRFLASLARMKPQPLIAATDFERAPVKVQLAG